MHSTCVCVCVCVYTHDKPRACVRVSDVTPSLQQPLRLRSLWLKHFYFYSIFLSRRCSYRERRYFSADPSGTADHNVVCPLSRVRTRAPDVMRHVTTQIQNIVIDPVVESKITGFSTAVSSRSTETFGYRIDLVR